MFLTPHLTRPYDRTVKVLKIPYLAIGGLLCTATLTLGLKTKFSGFIPNYRPGHFVPVVRPVKAQEQDSFPVIINQLITIHRRMNAASERLERLNERLGSRLRKLASQNTNISLAQQLLNEAEIQQQKASQEILNFDILISSAANSPSSHSEIRETIDQVAKTKAALIDSLKATQKTLREVKYLNEKT